MRIFLYRLVGRGPWGRAVPENGEPPQRLEPEIPLDFLLRGKISTETYGQVGTTF